TQGDYYRFLSLLQPAFNPANWLPPKKRQVAALGAAERAVLEKHNAEIDRQEQALNKQKKDLLKKIEEQIFEEKLVRLPEPIRADTKTAIRTPAVKRSEVQKYLADKFGPMLQVTGVDATRDARFKQQEAAINREIAKLTPQRRSASHLQAVYDA